MVCAVTVQTWGAALSHAFTVRLGAQASRPHLGARVSCPHLCLGAWVSRPLAGQRPALPGTRFRLGAQAFCSNLDSDLYHRCTIAPG